MKISPERGWVVAGAVSFPCLTIALGYPPANPLVAVAIGMAGIGVVAGAVLTARGRGSRVRTSAWAWAGAYAVGVLVYLIGLDLSWPQPDNATIVRPDGSGGLNGDQALLLLMFSVGLTLLLGAALDEGHHAASGRRLRAAMSAAASWAIAMLPLPILIVLGIYATSMLGDTLGVVGEVPAHLLGLVCVGAVAGLVVGTIAEGCLRRLRV